MPDLLVRGVDEVLAKALEERVGARGRSAEAEHREILKEALVRPRKHALAELLASNPDVGTDADAAQVWGRLRAPNHEHALDKQIAAIALVHDLTVITRHSADFAGTGVKVLNPFVVPAPPS